MQKEAPEYVKKCDQCQKFAPNMHQLGEVLNPLSSPWPFAQWGLDIVRHFPTATGNKRYLLVGMDYFTKWVEAEPLANIRDVDAKKLFGKTLSHDSGSLVPLSRTMAFSLIANLSGDTILTWKLRTDTPPHLIPKEMGKLRLLSRS